MWQVLVQLRKLLRALCCEITPWQLHVPLGTREQPWQLALTLHQRKLQLTGVTQSFIKTGRKEQLTRNRLAQQDPGCEHTSRTTEVVHLNNIKVKRVRLFGSQSSRAASFSIFLGCSAGNCSSPSPQLPQPHCFSVFNPQCPETKITPGFFLAPPNFEPLRIRCNICASHHRVLLTEWKKHCQRMSEPTSYRCIHARMR